jgi:hypothetical protein
VYSSALRASRATINTHIARNPPCHARTLRHAHTTITTLRHRAPHALVVESTNRMGGGEVFHSRKRNVKIVSVYIAMISYIKILMHDGDVVKVMGRPWRPHA